jgi:hypothetical protein
MRDEIKRLPSVVLAIGDDPMARQMDIEASAGSYAGERPFGRAANLPSTRPRKPTDADMGPHNWGGGEERPKGGKMRGRRRGVGSPSSPLGQGSGVSGSHLGRSNHSILEMTPFKRIRCNFLPGCGKGMITGCCEIGRKRLNQAAGVPKMTILLRYSATKLQGLAKGTEHL